MKKILNYLNPIVHLGERNYSFIFPLISLPVAILISELMAQSLFKDPAMFGLVAIFAFLTLIIYFSFRSGLRGGIIAAIFTVAYYFYIIYSRHYKGKELESGISTTLVLGVVYLLLAGTIGWLKETIDGLIEREADGKKRLQAIIQQLPVGIVVTDDKKKVMESNKRLELILGTKFPRDYVIGEGTEELIKPSESPLLQALEKNRPIVGKEFMIERADGKHVYIQVSASPIHNKRGRVVAAASIVSDITEQKELERRKDDFVNIASHELKTPLTSMKLYVDVLLKSLKKHSDPQALRMLKSVKDQTQRLQELVNDLLDVSRLQTGKLSFTTEKFKLNALVKQSVEDMKGITDKQKIVYSGEGILMVNADKFRIYQVITNLVTNAVKYSPRGSTIRIKTKRADGKALVSIEDSGIGIAKSEHKKIFDRLYQVSNDKKNVSPGFGLGLYISREIVKRHKGSIWVESEKGKGSTFYFSLPLEKGA